MKKNIILFALIFHCLFAFKVNGENSDPGFNPVTVFSYDKNSEDVFGYRIPSMVTTKDGYLIAVCERRVGIHDHAQNDIVVRRSLNNGKDWEEIQVIAEDGKNCLIDPCMVALESGRLILIYQRFPYGIHARKEGWIHMADTGYDGPRNTKSYITYSDDQGELWTNPVEITKQLRPHDKIHVGSPGIGIQLKQGKHKGRVIIPLYETRKIDDDTRVWDSSVAWSDDEGKSWHLSNNISHYDQTGYANEAQVVEESDGSILLIARNQGGIFRKYAESNDGGLTWSNIKLNYELPGVACMGSALRYSYGKGKDNIMLYVNPASTRFRTRGTIRISYDNGHTWPVARTLPPAYFAYSCLTKLNDGRIGLLYETDQYRKINFVTLDLKWILQGDEVPTKNYFSVPMIDLDKKEQMQEVVDKEKGVYLGHVTNALLDDGKTILAVYPKGHGKGEILYKKSFDGGKSWSERLPVPSSWKTSKEVPTLFRVEDKTENKRIIMFSGLYPVRMAVTDNMGGSWSELEKVGDWGGIVAMGDVISLKTGKGHYMAMFHDDGRFISEDSERKAKEDRKNFNSPMFTLYKTFSYDGGLTWETPEIVYASREMHLCEPGFIRSPDGGEISVLLRENSRRFNSQIIFTGDEGKTFSAPKPLPNELNGDRHTLRYSNDGRILVVFRDNSPTDKYKNALAVNREGKIMYEESKKAGFISPTQGDWVGWVGTYDDLRLHRPGQYRIRFKKNYRGADCCYPGVELLPDDTFVVTTYGHWQKGEKPYILSLRCKLNDLDKMLK